MRIIAPFTAAWLVLAALPAAAQVNPFRGVTATLTPADSALLWSSIDQLNQTRDVAAGAKTTWSNPDSGRQGLNIVTGLFTRDGLHCHAVRHELIFTPGKPATVFNLNWCLAPDGRWKIAS
jgi:hypothetical protein